MNLCETALKLLEDYKSYACHNRQEFVPPVIEDIDKYPERLILGPYPAAKGFRYDPWWVREVDQFLTWIGLNAVGGPSRYAIRIEAVDSKPGREFHLRGYVSWLGIDQQPTPTENGELVIFYDKEMIWKHIVGEAVGWRCWLRRLHNLLRGECQEYCRIYRTVATKIFLHEAMHVILHLARLTKECAPSSDKLRLFPSCFPEEEEQAWGCCMHLWARLMAAFARDSRDSVDQDNTWHVA
jgi:hypothetical protein